MRRLLPQLFSDFANSIQRPFKTAAATIIAKRGSSQASKACTIVPNQHHHSQKKSLKEGPQPNVQVPFLLIQCTTGECIIYIIANVSIKISDSRNGHKNSYDREKYYNKNQPPTKRTHFSTWGRCARASAKPFTKKLLLQCRTFNWLVG